MPGGLPEPARAREKLQPADVWRDLKVSPYVLPETRFLPLYSHLKPLYRLQLNSFVPCFHLYLFSLVEFIRTLLALGCHVGMGDEKAEENLKKIKLPKTYVLECVADIVFMCVVWHKNCMNDPT